MDFSLTDEQRLLQQNARELGARFGLEYWREKDRAHAFVDELWEALAEGGWLGVTIPEVYGGGGLGVLEYALVIEEIARAGGGATVAQVFMYPLLTATAILRHGSEAQKRRYLPGLASGRSSFAIGVTGPERVVITLAITTSARRDGDNYLINGQKTFITGLERADGLLLIARTTPADAAPKRSRGLSLFLVDARAPGIRTQPIEKVGTHCLPAEVVFLDDVVVSAADRVGEEGRGWEYLVDTLNVERMATTAGAVGTGELALALAAQYARERVVFERPIGANQGLQFPLARLKAEIELARLMNYKAAWLFDQGEPCAAEGNMAKLVATESAFAACDQAMQTLGGYGYTREYHIERLWRDARLFRIAPVSQEMVLSFVAQHVLGLPRSY